MVSIGNEGTYAPFVFLGQLEDIVMTRRRPMKH